MNPSMCGENELTLPEVNCDCEGLSNRISDLEDWSEVTGERLDTLEGCCNTVQETISEHGQNLTLINNDITEINEKINSLEGLTVVKVNTLPSTGAPNTIYLVPNGDSSVMWMYIEGNWEKVGDTSVDLSMYATKTELNQKMNNPAVGYVAITSTNSAPNYPGTWTRVGMDFQGASFEDTACTWNGTNTSSGECIIVRKDKSVQIRLNWNSKIFMDNDDSKVICTIRFSSLGITAMRDIHVLGYSDGDNCVGMFSIIADANAQTVTVTKQDAIHKGGEYKGNAWEVIIDLMFAQASMDASACDKFYWKRTA